MEAQRKEKERLKETLEENQQLVVSLKEEIQMLRENEKKIKEQKDAAEHVSRRFCILGDEKSKWSGIGFGPAHSLDSSKYENVFARVLDLC